MGSAYANSDMFEWFLVKCMTVVDYTSQEDIAY